MRTRRAARQSTRPCRSSARLEKGRVESVLPSFLVYIIFKAAAHSQPLLLAHHLGLSVDEDVDVEILLELDDFLNLLLDGRNVLLLGDPAKERKGERRREISDNF